MAVAFFFLYHGFEVLYVSSLVCRTINTSHHSHFHGEAGQWVTLIKGRSRSIVQDVLSQVRYYIKGSSFHLIPSRVLHSHHFLLLPLGSVLTLRNQSRDSGMCFSATEGKLKIGFIPNKMFFPVKNDSKETVQHHTRPVTTSFWIVGCCQRFWSHIILQCHHF